METHDLTTDEALSELIDYLTDAPAPPGYYSMVQIFEQAKGNGVTMTMNHLDNRLRKGVADGTVERVRVGRVYYYRKVKK